MIIQNIEVWAEEFKKTHTWTELVNEVLKMYTDDINALNMLMLRVPKVRATESVSADDFDMIMRDRRWGQSIREIKKLTDTDVDVLTRDYTDINAFCDSIIKIIETGYRKIPALDNIKLVNGHENYEVKMLCCLAAMALDACLTAPNLASVLYTITYRLIYHVHFCCTISLEAYMSEETSQEKDISWYIYSGLRFYSGTLKPID